MDFVGDGFDKAALDGEGDIDGPTRVAVAGGDDWRGGATGGLVGLGVRACASAELGDEDGLDPPFCDAPLGWPELPVPGC